MPLYEYRCKSCGSISEFLVHGQKTHNTLECRACGSKELDKILSVPALVKNEARTSGQTCCGREERCDTPPCSSGGCCRG